MISFFVFHVICFFIACPIMLACFYTDDKEITLASLIIAVFGSMFGIASLLLVAIMGVVTWGGNIVLFKKD